MDKEALVEKYECRDSTNISIIIQMCKDGSRLTLPTVVWVANYGTYFYIASAERKIIYAISIIYA